jgi:beta-lactamase class A
VVDRPLRRRGVLAAGLAGLGAALAGCGPAPAAAPPPPAGTPGLDDLEARFGGRLGVAALDTGSGASVGHRADERFLMCSTVKVAVVATVLRRSVTEPGLLDRRLHWTRADLLSYAPATTAALATGMTVAELCGAALTVSDNTAANLLSAQVGGPPGVTAFLRSVGDPTSRADRTEPALNDVVGDLDTTTPAAFVRTLQALALGDALPPPQRDRLIGWMRANTTGDAQIRAGVPAGSIVADKTGSGSAGESNDVAVVEPPGRAPIVVVVLTAPTDPRTATGKATIAAATREVLGSLGVR